ncbi:MAG: lanthionine synthetase LanC family protein [Gemmatimonadaceae bacterium]
MDADSASLLEQFREPRNAVEAVIRFSQERSVEPELVLESAYPMLRRMLEGGVLVQALADGEAKPPATFLTAGDTVLGSTVVRTLQLLEDSELYLLRGLHRRSVLKLERAMPVANGSMRARLEREAEILGHLEGVAPRLFGRGSIDDRSYLEMEFVPGVDASAAAEEWRRRKDEVGRRELLTLAEQIADAYARLHAQSILHGDVHPRNILIGTDGSVRLIDFGLSRSIEAGTSMPATAERGGVAFFFEPELAQQYLDGKQPGLTTFEGEQYSVAALIYSMVTGAYWQDFRLDRQGMLQDIVEREVLSFADRGVAPWPSLESVLRRALSKDPEDRFPSMAAFTDAIRVVSDCAPYRPLAVRTSAQLAHVLARTKAAAMISGPWMHGESPKAPVASLFYGASGIALGLLCISQREGDALGLATADVWVQHAMRATNQPGAFDNPEIDITPERVGEASPFHTASGVHATAALIARAAADFAAQSEATSEFIVASQRPALGLDITLGKASTILGSAILLDAAHGLPGDWTALRELADGATSELWQTLDGRAQILDAGIDYLGIAHGWAGFLYATLQWSRISGNRVPDGAARRLDELSALAIPAGRGLEWPWLVREPGDPVVMAGWCNGSSGQVLLWSLAHDMFGDARWLEMAEGAAWNAWEAPDLASTLCCGLAGRAYALLNFYRHTGESIWLDRARALGERAAKSGGMPTDYPRSLFKGEFGLAVLAADLEVPNEAVMPFVEPFGYARPATRSTVSGHGGQVPGAV